MIEFVWIVTIVLGGVAALDRRAWPMLLVIALSVFQMLLSEALIEDILYEVAMKAPIDLIAGLMALMIITRERWSLMAPALFCVTLLAHAAYWLAYWNGIDLWLWYAHSLNLFFVATMLAVAIPGGGQLVGIARTWLVRLLLERRRTYRLGDGATHATHEALKGLYRQSDVRSGRNLHLSASE